MKISELDERVVEVENKLYQLESDVGTLTRSFEWLTDKGPSVDDLSGGNKVLFGLGVLTLCAIIGVGAYTAFVLPWTNQQPANAACIAFMGPNGPVVGNCATVGISK